MKDQATRMSGEAAQRPRVYISGPLTGSGNILENVERAMHAARTLIDAGCSPFCPHLSYHLDPAEELSHATWMEIDLPWMYAAQAVLRLPGESRGADIETARAKDLKIPVFHSLADLIAHFAGRRADCADQGLDGTFPPDKMIADGRKEPSGLITL